MVPISLSPSQGLTTISNRHLEQQLADLHRMYNGWATKPKDRLPPYDRFFSPINYPAPRILALAVSEIENAQVLDLACGTGRLAQEMAAFPIKPAVIDGIDGSIEMLKLARNKGYRNLILGNVHEPQTMRKQLAKYDVILSCGFFGGLLSGSVAVRTLEAYVNRMANKATIGITIMGDPDLQSPLMLKLPEMLDKKGFDRFCTFNAIGDTVDGNPTSYQFFLAYRK